MCVCVSQSICFPFCFVRFNNSFFFCSPPHLLKVFLTISKCYQLLATKINFETDLKINLYCLYGFTAIWYCLIHLKANTNI